MDWINFKQDIKDYNLFSKMSKYLEINPSTLYKIISQFRLPVENPKITESKHIPDAISHLIEASTFNQKIDLKSGDSIQVTDKEHQIVSLIDGGSYVLVELKFYERLIFDVDPEWYPKKCWMYYGKNEKGDIGYHLA